MQVEHRLIYIRYNVLVEKHIGNFSQFLWRAWTMAHINECEVIGPKRFRDEIQMTIMEAYKKYCM